MSFVPIRVSSRATHQAPASVAILRRYDGEYCDFRFAPSTLRAAGWHRGTRISPFLDLEAGELMFATAGQSDPHARSLTSQGGHQLSARWSRVAEFRSVIPDLSSRRRLRLIRAGEGQVVLDLAQLA